MKKVLLLFLIVKSTLMYAQDDGAVQFYTTSYQTLSRTDYGMIIKKTHNHANIEVNDKLIPVGANYVHIFFDENGNVIGDNIPNGVPWINYVIHVIYRKAAGRSYSFVQTSGKITGETVIKNAVPPERDLKGTIIYAESISVLRPSDKEDVEFQLTRTEDVHNTVTKTTIGTYTIPLSGYYNASIDLGILNSQLHNPTYSLVNSIDGSAKVVKLADDGDRIMTTFMGTIYWSPIVFFEKNILKLDIPTFKLKGRSSVADHNMIERIYPTFGLSINEKTFENIFYGINWEIIRGGSLFIGYHTGKVNIFKGAAN
ncbi:MAG TPA: hypothetical protein VN721_13930, partial [Flavipsychrobacter sp.]|nr:hypothetical protein [Flavipsychrobacter sp.]